MYNRGDKAVSDEVLKAAFLPDLASADGPKA